MRSSPFLALGAVMVGSVLALACGSSVDDVGNASGAQAGEGSSGSNTGGSSSSSGGSSSGGSSSSGGASSGTTSSGSTSSSGWSGEEDAGSDASVDAGGGEMDASDAAAPSDGGPPDAGGPACVSPVDGAPTHTTTANVEWSCPGTAADVRVVSIAEPTNMTLFFSHGTTWTAGSTIQLREGCEANGKKLGEYRYDGRTHLHVLAPGLYTLVQCRDNLAIPGAFRTDPVSTPPNPNTSCATATDISAGAVNEPYRQFDGSKLYFKLKTPATVTSPVLWGRSVAAPTRLAAGSYHVQVQTVCDDPTSAIFDGNGTFSSVYDGTGHTLNNLPPSTTYWVVFSAIDPGIELRVGRSSSSVVPP